MKIKNIFGWLVLLWAFIFAILETRYFGDNWWPQTQEELICDITGLLLMVCGLWLSEFDFHWWKTKKL